jgi:penicillin-binding protein 1A
VARQATIVALFAAMALLGTLSGVFFAYAGDLAQISALDTYQPHTITRLLALDGRPIQEFATERRVVIGYDDMAPVLRQAILASEDAGFEEHFGLSISRIVATAAKELLTGRRAGASTITQQVARMLFLQSEYMVGGVYARTGARGWERKIKEIILAIQLEKRYTKREILTFYANHVTLGHGAFGVEAASQMYFDKSAADLTVEEAATIAAIIQTPQRLSPFVNPDQTLARRNNYVLRRMAEEGFITRDEAEEAAARPLVLQGQRTPEPSIAPHFAEEIRKVLEQKYTADVLYQAGLRVQTTLDADLQEAANTAMDRGLRRLDKRRNGYRRPARNILDEGLALERFTADRWSRAIVAGDIVPALVTAVAPAAEGGSARVRIAQHEVELPRSAFAWTRRTAAADLFTVGDVIEVEVRALQGNQPSELALEQSSAIEGALLAIDNRTGQIRAMVGGFSFAQSKFNRAVQAQRQVGSLFKPVVFTAAIDRGFTPVSVFVDEPVEYDVGPNQPLYAPRNYDREFEGPVTLRRALEQSRNIPAVKAMVEIGPEQVVGYARRFGLRGDYPLYLSVALGAIEATLLEITSGYSAFPNQGVRMEPYSVISIADREGNILEENRSRPQEAIRADTAFVMTNLLRGTVQRGTAGAAAALDWPLAGKTGTVNDNTDAWFVGFDPDITVGVWVGYDMKRPIGPTETGGTAALPIWIDFMREYIDKRGDRTNPPAFDAPGNIVFVTLESGLREAFINGTQPQTGFAGLPEQRDQSPVPVADPPQRDSPGPLPPALPISQPLPGQR